LKPPSGGFFVGEVANAVIVVGPKRKVRGTLASVGF
jgi:hypothetical protein